MHGVRLPVSGMIRVSLFINLLLLGCYGSFYLQRKYSSFVSDNPEAISLASTPSIQIARRTTWCEAFDKGLLRVEDDASTITEVLRYTNNGSYRPWPPSDGSEKHTGVIFLDTNTLENYSEPLPDSGIWRIRMEFRGADELQMLAITNCNDSKPRNKVPAREPISASESGIN